MITNAIAIIATLALGATASAAQDAATVPFRTLARGTDSRIDTRRELVARTVGSWHLLWYKHSGGGDPPPIDVTRELVIAVFSGKQPAAYHAIEIVTVAREGETLVVHYRNQNRREQSCRSHSGDAIPHHRRPSTRHVGDIH